MGLVQSARRLFLGKSLIHQRKRKRQIRRLALGESDEEDSDFDSKHENIYSTKRCVTLYLAISKNVTYKSKDLP